MFIQLVRLEETEFSTETIYLININIDEIKLLAPPPFYTIVPETH